MKTKYTWSSKECNVVNKLASCLHIFFVSNDVISSLSGEVELLVGIKDEISKIFLKIRDKNSSIKIIGDSTTVHGITNKISHGIPREYLVT
jgi:hypothetical protein